MTTDELLDELARWCNQASVGDNGEQPGVELEYGGYVADGWEASVFSFYDGSGTGRGATPAEALGACLSDLRGADTRAAERERNSVVYALSRALRLSHDEARRRLGSVEGWATGTEQVTDEQRD